MQDDQMKESGYAACPTTAKTATCGTCTMCYTTDKNIAIAIH
jgi:hypothetical protein